MLRTYLTLSGPSCGTGSERRTEHLCSPGQTSEPLSLDFFLYKMWMITPVYKLTEDSSYLFSHHLEGLIGEFPASG